MTTPPFASHPARLLLSQAEPYAGAQATLVPRGFEIGSECDSDEGELRSRQCRVALAARTRSKPQEVSATGGAD